MSVHSDSGDFSPPTAESTPNQFPKIVGAEIAALTSGKRVAGDFFESFRVGAERVLFGLLDVAGRAETNRAILSAAQNLFRSSGLELFAAADVNESEAMTALSLRLNRAIMEAAVGVHSCPAFIGCYHERFGTLCYTNAGHTPGLLLDSTSIAALTSTGLPLGLFSHATAEAPTVGMEKGAVLLLVSRGVVDGTCAAKKGETQGEEYGLERVKQYLQSQTAPGARMIAESLLKAASEYSCVAMVPEDMTALCLVRSA